MCVDFQVIEHVELASRPGGPFSIRISREPLQVFLPYFNKHCSVTTVSAKVNQILKLLEVAEEFIQEQGDNLSLRKVAVAREFIQNIQNAGKRAGRTRAAMLREKQSQLNATFILPADFQIFMRTIQSTFKCNTNTFNDLLAKIGKAAETQKKFAHRSFGEH